MSDRRPPGVQDPHGRHWTPADLARRRALATARTELEGASMRQDPYGLIWAWRQVVDALERDERVRRPGSGG